MIKFIAGEPAFLPVPSSFVKLHMNGAPPEYVKVYIYGLYLAQHGAAPELTALEEELHLSGAQIVAALDYWEGKGLIEKENAGYRWLTEAQGASAEGKQLLLTPELYPKHGFNTALTAALGRVPSRTDLEKAYDFTDIYGLPEDVALLLIEHCAQIKGDSVSFNYIDKVARSWASSGIITIELAKQHLEDFKSTTSDVKKIMRRMGLIGKNPGKTELDLYEKWTGEWGFTPGAILAAMEGKEFAHISGPFKYLDEMLRALYEKGAVDARGVTEASAADAAARNAVKEILSALGYAKKSVYPRYAEYYENWLKDGHDMDTILTACAQCAKRGARRFEAVDSTLKEWHTLGLFEHGDIHAHVQKLNTAAENIEKIYRRAGITRRITDADIRLYTEYTENCGMSQDVLMYAAEISSVKAAEPLSYMKKLLSAWRDCDVTTLQAAKQQDLSRVTKSAAAKKEFYQRNFEEPDSERIKREMLAEMENDDED